MQNNLKRKNPIRGVTIAIGYFSTERQFDLVSFKYSKPKNILFVSPDDPPKFVLIH